jgi:hypothetical protein
VPTSNNRSKTKYKALTESKQTDRPYKSKAGRIKTKHQAVDSPSQETITIYDGDRRF